MDKEQKCRELLEKWQKLLRLRDWDIRLQLVDTPWRKTGDIKMDLEDKKAILLINDCNPESLHLEEVVVHELLHLKLWGLDRITETLFNKVFGKDTDDEKYDFALEQYMICLESTVEDLTKTCLALADSEGELCFGRLEKQVRKELGSSEEKKEPQ